MLRLALALLAFVSTAHAQLNDTGLLDCYNHLQTPVGTVSTTTPDPEPTGFNEQDCTRGRAAAEAMGVLTKVGASTVAGRDYTKIAHNGSVLTAGAALGAGPTDWACTRDNVTGLLWEVKTTDGGLRDRSHQYTWFNTDTNENNGVPGTETSFGCGGTLAGNTCNTSRFVAAVNAGGGLCGRTDWRMPTEDELVGLVAWGNGGTQIDTTYFPNSASSIYMAAETFAATASDARRVSFGGGDPNVFQKSDAAYVRLVAGGTP
ncbi:DUF1566 domain-containing protein [Pseudomarimonas arenosa]|uniref:DUF1566 domain-containing protein n=1 Tax=Pseudomarimonas arenosa TaxID=2774145 RepID=A0AAW3ZMA7_9GAMM|nr:DUF1566 domain-containing protein [Pseudomarimonas arenosa]MBD8527283.1 DUF1566 domain-containing protein [Pseudomarimonas arenosa]